MPVRGGATGSAHLDEQLVGRGRRRQVGHEELLRRQHALAARGSQDQLAVERGDDGRQLAGGIGVGEAAADRPPVPDLHVTDLRHRLGEERAALAHERGRLDGALAGHRPDGEMPVVEADAREAVDVVEIDDVRRPHEAEAQQRDEALPAREHLRLVAVPREDAERLVDRARAQVVESRRLHGPSML